MQNLIIYEQPLSERIRTFLRLEHLFSQTIHFQNGCSIWDSHASVSALIEILMTLERSDIRSEILKELDRQMVGLSKLIDTPAVDRVRLKSTLDQLSLQTHKMQKLPSKWGSEIRDNELLNSVRQRVAISGGTCGFDIPAYHHWLHQPKQLKSHSLTRWLTDINLLRESILLVLKMVRESSLFEKQNATGGFYQKTFDSQNPCQLLRIGLPTDSAIYPEVSGNKLRVNIRFLSYSESGRAKQCEQALDFNISCCAI